MAWTQDGINYMCDFYGDANHCVVSSGLTFYYLDIHDQTGQLVGGTSDIVWLVTQDTIVELTNQHGVHTYYPKDVLDSANHSEVTSSMAFELDNHDENSGDQWCLAECYLYMPFLFEFKVTNTSGTTIITAQRGDTVRLCARIARFDSDPCAHYDLTFYTDSVARTGQISQKSGDTYVGDGVGGELVYNIWTIPTTQPLGTFPHFGVVESNTDEDQEKSFTITAGPTNCTNPDGADGTILNCGIPPLDALHKWKCMNGTWVDQGYNAVCLEEGCTDPVGPIGSEACIDGYWNTCDSNKQWVPNVPAEPCAACSSYLTKLECETAGCYWYSDFPFMQEYCHSKKEDPMNKYLIYGGAALVGLAIVITIIKSRRQ